MTGVRVTGVVPGPRRGVVTAKGGRLAAVLWSVPRREPMVAGLVAMLIVGDIYRLYDPPVVQLVWPLRIAALVLAIGAAGMLDDPLRPYVDAVPVPLWRRQGARVAAAVVAVVCGWLLVIGSVALHPSARAAAAEGTPLPLIALTVEMFALVLVGLAVAGAAVRRRGTGGLLVGGGALLCLCFLLVMVPDRWTLTPPWEPFSSPGADQLWVAPHLRWAALGCAAAVALAWSVRDPYRADLHTSIDRSLR